MRILARRASPAEPRFVSILDSDTRQRFSQRGLIELRITTRAREAPHINQYLNSMRYEDVAKLFTTASRMSDSPNCNHLANHEREV